LRTRVYRLITCILGLAVAASIPSLACFGQGRCPTDCSQFGIDQTGSSPLQSVTIPPKQTCSTGMSTGFPIPDPQCTPGAVNPTITVDVLANPAFRTCCIRNDVTSEAEKKQTYEWYRIAEPSDNFGSNQMCELDHLVPLELGGADTLDNIWPQCGPDGLSLNDRYFKKKDTVENYLAAQVKAGNMALQDAQRGIATDWTQYLGAAEAACPGGRC
jgi:hypothetical protein